MKVSVIVPTYNSSSTLQRTIASLKAQTLEGCEFIFIDDFSSDNTVEIAKSLIGDDTRFTIVSQPHRTDPFQARQRGISLAKGEYIMFLDADDEFIPTACEKAYNIAKEQAVDIFCFGSTVIPAKGTSELELRHTQKHLDSFENFTGKIEGQNAVRSFYFKHNRFGTSICLWKKIFRRTVLLEAVKDIIPTAPLRYGQDLFQLILTMLHTSSLYVDNSIKLHKYHLGAGGTQQGSGSLSLTNFERMLTTKNSFITLINYFDNHNYDSSIAKRAIKHSKHSYLNTCSGNFWYLKDNELLEGFNKLFSTWGEEIYTTPFFYSPTNLLRFKNYVVAKLEQNNPLRPKLSKRLYVLFLSIPFYKSKLYFKPLFKR